MSWPGSERVNISCGEGPSVSGFMFRLLQGRDWFGATKCTRTRGTYYGWRVYRRAVLSLLDIQRSCSRAEPPLQVHEGERSLRAHPDREFCPLLLGGMTEGFRIGFRYASCSCIRAKSSTKSAVSNPMEEYLSKEVERVRVIGPLEPDTLPTAHVSGFGVAPKKNIVQANGDGLWTCVS